MQQTRGVDEDAEQETATEQETETEQEQEECHGHDHASCCDATWQKEADAATERR